MLDFWVLNKCKITGTAGRVRTELDAAWWGWRRAVVGDVYMSVKSNNMYVYYYSYMYIIFHILFYMIECMIDCV